MYTSTRDLIKKLNDATKAYDEGHPYMSDKEWDDLYFELQQREEKYKIIYPDSPTNKISYEVVSELNKVKHNHPMLSLAKTKDLNEIRNFDLSHVEAGTVAMLKMDGLTCSLTYNNGLLVRAETRGDGEIGEDVTHNALVISNIPKTIPWNEEVIVDGEVICKYSDFEDFSEQYKNPRNFASGSIRLLDSSECAKRKLSFIAWDMISDLPDSYSDTLIEKLSVLQFLGFEVVPWVAISGSDDLQYDVVHYLKATAEKESYPIDGLVFKCDDCKVYKNLGYTDHHFRGGLAYKFYDETYTTYLRHIDWDVSRTGTLTPVAVFDPVDINGSTVSRASVHNLTLLEQTLGTPYEGQEIEVFKANEIIPQIYSANKNISGKVIKIPTICPICGEQLSRKQDGIAEVLICTNNNCRGKVLTKLEHFVSKPCMNIDGLARNILELLYDFLDVRTFSDIYGLTKEELATLPTFAETKVNNIHSAIQASIKTKLNNFITAIGIPNIGAKQADQICSVCNDWDDFIDKVNNKFDWTTIEGFGEKTAQTINSFDYSDAIEVEKYLEIGTKKIEMNDTNSLIAGKRFVITGSLTDFKNRDELIQFIKANSGIVQGSVNKQTDFLINNDVLSNSSKNKKAKELGIPIITDHDLKCSIFSL